MKVLCVVFLFLLPGISAGADLLPRSQWGDKFLGISVRVGCPTLALIEEIRREGEQMGAETTLFPEVAGAALCPSTIYGPMWGNSDVKTWGSLQEMSGEWRVLGGVTVGLHYRLHR